LTLGLVAFPAALFEALEAKAGFPAFRIVGGQPVAASGR